MNPEKIQELKDAHGSDLALVSIAGTSLVFRKPSRHEYDRWFDSRDGGATKAARELSQACLVYPDRDAMIAALDARPAALMCEGGILTALLELSGMPGRESEGATSIKKL